MGCTGAAKVVSYLPSLYWSWKENNQKDSPIRKESHLCLAQCMYHSHQHMTTYSNMKKMGQSSILCYSAKNKQRCWGGSINMQNREPSNIVFQRKIIYEKFGKMLFLRKSLKILQPILNHTTGVETRPR